MRWHVSGVREPIGFVRKEIEVTIFDSTSLVIGLQNRHLDLL